MTISEVLGDTEDAVIFQSAATEATAKVATSGRRDRFQSGDSRAWGRSGDVD